MRKLEEESCDLPVIVCGGEGASRGKVLSVPSAAEASSLGAPPR